MHKKKQKKKKKRQRDYADIKMKEYIWEQTCKSPYEEKSTIQIFEFRQKKEHTDVSKIHNTPG